MLKDYSPQSKNANRHTQRGMKALEDSIRRDGWIGAITVAADGETFDGSARLDVAAIAGFEAVLVVETDGSRPVVLKRTDIPTASDARAKRLGVTANRVAQMDLAWDTDVLAELNTDGLLDGLWYPDELDTLLASVPTAGEGGDDFDTTPQESGETRVKRGDVWRVGEHRLMCGDSTSADDVSRLMGEDRAEMVFTSPPYNSGVGGYKPDYYGKQKKFYVSNTDDRTEDEWVNFCVTVLCNLSAVLVCDNAPVIWNVMYTANCRKGYGEALFAGAHPFKVRETICRDKNRGFPSASKGILSRNWELVFVLSAGVPYFSTQGLNEVRYNKWDIPSGEQDARNAATFPLALPARALEDYSYEGHKVIDPFLGVGTTLIAAHRTGRKCFGMEIEPVYCDVILRRAEAEGIGPIELVSSYGSGNGSE